MINAFTAIKQIVSILKDSQDNPDSYRFALNSEIKVRDFDPGDFRIDGVVPSDGAYIYLESTEFDPREMSNDAQGHEPVFCVDVYCSKKAKQNSDGSISQAASVANSAMRDVVSDIYNCIMNTTFKGVLNTQLSFDDNFGDTLVTKIVPLKNEMVLTLKHTENCLAVAAFRMRFLFAVTEIPGQALYYTLSGVDDRLHAMRDESELADDV